MADSYIAIDEPAVTDKKLDTEQLTVGANTVERERVQIAGAGATDLALPVAHDAVDAGNPLKIGGFAKAAAPTDVSADGDRVNAWFDLAGRLAVWDGGLAVSIDDGGNTITVDGTVTANLGTTDTDNLQVCADVLNLVARTLGSDTYTEATSLGFTIGAVRRDADTTLVNTTNEFGPLQMDANGRLKVEVFSGETLPVSGTVTANLAAGTNNIGDVDILSIAAGDNNIGNVDVVTLPALPAGTNNIGDVDVLSVVPGTGATNLGKAEDAGHTTGDVGVAALGVRVDTPNTALTGTDADYSVLALNKLGSVRVAALEDDLATAATAHTYKYYTNAGAVTDGIIWSPAAGKRWFLTTLVINTSAAATVTIEDDVAAGDVVRFKFELAANSGVAISFPIPMFSGEDAADLLVTTSAGNIYITAVGYEI